MLENISKYYFSFLSKIKVIKNEVQNFLEIFLRVSEENYFGEIKFEKNEENLNNQLKSWDTIY